jgi:hypothetical protein
MTRILMLLVATIVTLGGLTACDAGHMDPIANGGDAPGDINSNHH